MNDEIKELVEKTLEVLREPIQILRRIRSIRNIEKIRSKSIEIIQRTPEWYRERLHRVGASELATVIQLNTYQTVETLIESKKTIFASLLNGEPYPELAEFNLIWGTIMEDVAKQEFNRRFNTEIHCDKNTFDTLHDLRFSPDGFALLNYNTETCEICPYSNPPRMNESHVVAVIEIKCPVTRFPASNKIPIYYVPQLLVPMAYLYKHVDMGIFVDVKIIIPRNPSEKNFSGFIAFIKDEERVPINMARMDEKTFKNKFVERHKEFVRSKVIFPADQCPNKGYQYVLPFIITDFVLVPLYNNECTKKFFIDNTVTCAVQSYIVQLDEMMKITTLECTKSDTLALE